MKPAGRNDLPDDPRNAEWTPATGPDGPVWVDRQDNGWTVWDPASGYRSASDDEFEADYELDVGPTTLDAPDPDDD
jgi:hypothetical protein